MNAAIRPPKPPTPKRPYGTGTIEVIWVDGRWQYRARYRIRGKREELGIKATEEEAHAACNAACGGVATGKLSIGVPTFREHTEAWIETEVGRNAHNKKSWRSLFNRNVAETAPFIDTPLDQITPQAAWLWVTRILPRHISIQTGDPISWQTRKHALGLARRSCQHACRPDVALLKVNPFDNVEMGERTQQDGEAVWDYLTLEEIDALLSCEGMPLYEHTAFSIAIYTGLRKGELAALRWENVRLADARPHVRVMKSWDNPTKTAKPRVAWLIPAAQDALRAWWHACGCPASGLVWPSRARRQRNATRELRRGYSWGWYNKTDKARGLTTLGWRWRAGITREVWFHHLRHTCASHLISGTWGVQLNTKEVAEMLGQDDETVTKTYAHLLPDAVSAKVAQASIAHRLPKAVVAKTTAISVDPQRYQAVRGGGVEPPTFGSGGNGAHAKSQEEIAAQWAIDGQCARLIAQHLQADVEALLAALGNGAELPGEAVRAIGKRALACRPVLAAQALASAGDADLGERLRDFATALGGVGQLVTEAPQPLPQISAPSKLAALLTPGNAARLWARVTRGAECWLWTGTVQRRGDGSISYGRLCLGKAVIPAHRFAWALEHSGLKDADEVFQTCGNRLCVRHLSVETRAEGHGRKLGKHQLT